MDWHPRALLAILEICANWQGGVPTRGVGRGEGDDEGGVEVSCQPVEVGMGKWTPRWVPFLLRGRGLQRVGGLRHPPPSPAPPCPYQQEAARG